MLKVGLTGGLACGKSFVGQALAELGCHLIEADELGHEVLLQGGEAYDGVVREFGAAILNADGAIDRKRLAAEVFGKPERLETLNRLVHPHIFRREAQLIGQLAKSDPHGIVVVAAAAGTTRISTV
jgi:dephospho-CoA kinase